MGHWPFVTCSYLGIEKFRDSVAYLDIIIAYEYQQFISMLCVGIN